MTEQKQKRIHDLVIKAMKDQLTPVQGAELDAWQAKDPENARMMGLFMDPEYVYKAVNVSRNLDVHAAWAKASTAMGFPDDESKPNTNTTNT